jgi:hypothetical protein
MRGATGPRGSRPTRAVCAAWASPSQPLPPPPLQLLEEAPPLESPSQPPPDDELDSPPPSQPPLLVDEPSADEPSQPPPSSACASTLLFSSQLAPFGPSVEWVDDEDEREEAAGCPDDHELKLATRWRVASPSEKDRSRSP